jgi:hypothetical protein
MGADLYFLLYNLKEWIINGRCKTEINNDDEKDI